MEPITLPGDIPGLLARGAPVRVMPGAWGDRAGLFLPAEPVAQVAFSTLPSHQGWGLMPVRDPATLSLDLRDPAGADRALRWLWSRASDRPLRMGAPVWLWDGTAQVSHRWALWIEEQPCLTTQRGRTKAVFATPDSRNGAATLVPALASIPLDHPDADLLALVAVCLHAAGRGA